MNWNETGTETDLSWLAVLAGSRLSPLPFSPNDDGNAKLELAHQHHLIAISFSTCSNASTSTHHIRRLHMDGLTGRSKTRRELGRQKQLLTLTLVVGPTALGWSLRAFGQRRGVYADGYGRLADRRSEDEHDPMPVHAHGERKRKRREAGQLG